MGDFPIEKFFDKNNVLGTGTIIKVDNKKYCVNNVIIRRDGTVVLECFGSGEQSQ